MKKRMNTWQRITAGILTVALGIAGVSVVVTPDDLDPLFGREVVESVESEEAHHGRVTEPDGGRVREHETLRAQETETDKSALVYKPDAVFQPGGAYGWLPPLSERALAGAQTWPGDPWEQMGVGYGSKGEVYAPPYLSNATYVANNAQAPWGQRGPKWGDRSYNLTGSVANLTISRVGDWTTGQEGHGVYWNLVGPLFVRNLWIEQVGANGVQVALRPAETKIHPSTWRGGRVVFDGVTLRQCGLINQGEAVRASWPFAYYATGHALEITNLHVQTSIPKAFASNGMSGRQSHGGLFVGPAAERPSLKKVDAEDPDAYSWAGYTFLWHGGFQPGDTFQTYFETPSLIVRRLEIEVVNSDREEVHLRNVKSAMFYRPYITEKGGQADIFVSDDCGSVQIYEALTDLVVTITSADNPHKAYGRPTFEVKAGEDFYWKSDQ